MEYLFPILLLLAAFLPAGYLVLRTNPVKKRGCGCGCAACGNREFCHRRKLRINGGKKSKPAGSKAKIN